MDREEQLYIQMSEVVAVLDSGQYTLKEALTRLTELAKLNGFNIVRRSTSVTFQYGDKPWVCVIVVPLYDGLPLWDYHTTLFLITL